MKGTCLFRPTVLFTAGFLLAGGLHVLDRLLVRSMLPETAAQREPPASPITICPRPISSPRPSFSGCWAFLKGAVKKK